MNRRGRATGGGRTRFGAISDSGDDGAIDGASGEGNLA